VAGDAIIWPPGFAPGECPIHVVNRIDVAASPAKVWPHLVRAGDWPNFYANASNVAIDGGGDDLHQNARFRWRTFGVGLDTQVREWVPNARIAWLATAFGIRAYHAWLIVPTDGGCTVVTEETQHGLLARAGKLIFPNRMHRWHQIWLEGLKARSEA
jgi:Polyketide cyclase / dehydrase and lipid transport